MGANVSSDGGVGGVGGGGGERMKRLDDIPESCIAVVLGHLDPPEICRLAGLNRAFHGASSADFIWESKLPPNYPFIVHKIFNIPNNDHDHDNHDNHDCDYHGNDGSDGEGFLALAKGLITKKDIFARLSRPNPFDGGTKEIWVDKRSGGVCLSISSEALSITGIDDRRYWNRITTDESRFSTVAYLLQMWWLEVNGELEFRLPAGMYSLFFRLQLGRSSKRFGRRVCNLEHVHGWDSRPVRLQLMTSDSQKSVFQYHFDNPGSWVCYHGGDFVVPDSCKPTKIKFSLTQIDCTHTKGGLSLDAVFVYPKGLSKKFDHFCRYVD